MKCSAIRSGCALVAALTLVLGAPAAPAPYGLTIRPKVGPFLDGKLPTQGAAISGDWSTVVAFPNLTFVNALGLAPLPGTSRLVVWEREGKVWSFENLPAVATKSLVLDLSNQCQGWDDSGLLGLAFHPNFANNHYVFIYYTWVSPGTVMGNPNQRPPTVVTGAYHDRLSRFTLDANGVAIPGSELVYVDQIADSVWHNGGGLFFHPINGFLYWTDGDDAVGPSQIIDQNLLSGVFRVDVDQRGGNISHPIPRQPLRGTTANYYIPNDNPFVGMSGVLEEFYALGLRSPHRMTFDSPSGRIFIGDVGAGTREEIDIIEPTDPAGLNFQWSDIEGLNGDLFPPYVGVNKRPVLDYGHDEGQAVIGGYVYRGSEFATDLGGKYIFGDNVQGKIWALDETTSPISKRLLCVLPKGPGVSSGADYTGLSSFGLDADQELYLCQMGNLGGQIFKLQRSGPPADTRDFPPLLSQTGAFANPVLLTRSSALIPYDVNTPLWSDRAVKTRWLVIPTNTTIHFKTNGEWTFPAGSVFVKHFELSVNETNTSVPRRRLETRFLVRDPQGGVFGATYKWRPDNSDADLLADQLDENISIQTATGTRTQTWHYPSRSECLQCHTEVAGGVLGIKTRQLNRNFAYPSRYTDNQLRSLNHIELFSPAVNEADIPLLPRLFALSDLSVTVEKRVRSYLDANCSHCHRPGGVRALWDGRFETPLFSAGIVNGAIFENLGIVGAKVVVPGNTNKSILYHRDNSLAPTVMMPPLAKNIVDTTAMKLIAEWITKLSPHTIPSPWKHQDIGAVGFSGDATYWLNVLSVSGGGDDIWNSADAFHYVYQPLVGDGEVVARVASLGNTDGWAKAGVMIRETLTPGSRHAFIGVTPGNGTAFQRRVNTGGGSDHTPGPYATAPYWVRLNRTGDLLTGSVSPDGINWTAVGSLTLTLPNGGFIGLAVTAHNNGSINYASVDHVDTSASLGALNLRPTVTLTSPVSGRTVTSASVVTLKATAADADGQVAKVEFFSGASKLGEVFSPPYTLAWANLPVGVRTLTARATDNRGATTTSLGVKITVIQALVSALQRALEVPSTGVPLLLPVDEDGEYVIEASTDLRIWMPVSTNTASGLELELEDQQPDAPARFYRARRLE